jgi:hypothetical protein
LTARNEPRMGQCLRPIKFLTYWQVTASGIKMELHYEKNGYNVHIDMFLFIEFKKNNPIPNGTRMRKNNLKTYKLDLTGHLS